MVKDTEISNKGSGLSLTQKIRWLNSKDSEISDKGSV